MRASTQWRQLQQLGRAFITASYFPPPASTEANLIITSTWNKTLEQGSGQTLNSIVRDSHPSFKSGHSRHFFGSQSNVSWSNSSPKLYFRNPSQVCKHWNSKQPGFKETLYLRTHVSSAQSSEPEYWDTPEELPADQTRVLRERDCDRNEEEGLRKVRKLGSHDGKMARNVQDDGVEWGQQHVRVREYETRQRASLSPNPPPKFQQDDIYIPVKACYISRRWATPLLKVFFTVTNTLSNLCFH